MCMVRPSNSIVGILVLRVTLNLIRRFLYIHCYLHMFVSSTLHTHADLPYSKLVLQWNLSKIITELGSQLSKAASLFGPQIALK